MITPGDLSKQRAAVRELQRMLHLAALAKDYSIALDSYRWLLAHHDDELAVPALQRVEILGRRLKTALVEAPGMRPDESTTRSAATVADTAETTKPPVGAAPSAEGGAEEQLTFASPTYRSVR